MKFKDYYSLQDNNVFLLEDLLTEIEREKLLNNTDPKRVERARKELRTRPPKLSEDGIGIEKLEYNFKAIPSTEFKRHHGYVKYEVETENITELFCDCKDFFYRLYAPLEKANLAVWDLNKKYNKRLTKTHNKKWTIKTNPKGELYVCKHLYALLEEYF